MLESLLPQLGLLVFLVVLNALFAGSEIALISLREGPTAAAGEAEPHRAGARPPRA